MKSNASTMSSIVPVLLCIQTERELILLIFRHEGLCSHLPTPTHSHPHPIYNIYISLKLTEFFLAMLVVDKWNVYLIY